jgi:hypothetical protein
MRQSVSQDVSQKKEFFSSTKIRQKVIFPNRFLSYLKKKNGAILKGSDGIADVRQFRPEKSASQTKCHKIEKNESNAAKLKLAPPHQTIAQTEEKKRTDTGAKAARKQTHKQTEAERKRSEGGTDQCCQLVCFRTKNLNLGKFWKVLQW